MSISAGQSLVSRKRVISGFGKHPVFLSPPYKGRQSQQTQKQKRGGVEVSQDQDPNRPEATPPVPPQGTENGSGPEPEDEKNRLEHELLGARQHSEALQGELEQLRREMHDLQRGDREDDRQEPEEQRERGHGRMVWILAGILTGILLVEAVVFVPRWIAGGKTAPAKDSKSEATSDEGLEDYYKIDLPWDNAETSQQPQAQGESQ